MSENTRIIMVGHLSNYVYCERAWLLNVAGVRDDPEIAELIRKVCPIKPVAIAPTEFLEDLSLSTTFQPLAQPSIQRAHPSSASKGCPLTGALMLLGLGAIVFTIYSLIQLLV